MSISALRLAVSTAGGSPTQRTHVGLLRELITSWGGVPTQWTVTGLLKEAIVNRGGSLATTQNNQTALLRQLVTQLGGTPSSYNDNWGLWDQIASLSTVGPPVLLVLALSGNTLAEDAAAGAVVGTILNNKAASTLSLSDDAGGRFALSNLGGGTWRVIRGATALDYETATSHNITIVETLAGATGNPKSTTLAITVTDVVEGAATLAAPTLGYPSPIASNPTTIPIALPGDWQSGDVVKLARSASVSMSSPTILSHTLTDGDIAAGTFSIGLSSVTLAGVTYFQAYGQRGGLDSTNKSNIVTWGDTVAPVITTATTGSITETSPLAVALAATDTGGVPALVSDGTTPGWYIAGGVDQLQFQIAIVGGVATLQWYGNGSQSYASPVDAGANNVYDVQIGAVDYSGNVATPLARAQTVTQIDQTPTAFTFTNVSGATLNTQYTSNTVTIAGLEPGFSIPASVAGAGFTYSKNGGAYAAAGSFTVQNGDTLTLRDTSANSNSVTNTATVTVGTYSTTWSVATPGSAATLTIGTGATGAGTARSKYINSVAGTQFIHNNNDGQFAFDKATLPVSNSKWHVEMRVDGHDPNGGGSRSVLFAVMDGGFDCNGGGAGGTFNPPGKTGVAGFTLSTRIGATQITWDANNGGSNSFPAFAGGVTLAANDRIIVEGDESTHVYNVYVWDASAGALMNSGAAVGTITLTAGIPTTTYVAAGGQGGDGTVANSDSGTVYFNPSGFVMTPTSGYSYYA